MTIDEALESGAPPIMAILRGISRHEAVAVGRALVGAGIRLLEVPFNSPEPEESIKALSDALGHEAAIGGGTILSMEMVDALRAAGGCFAVSPNSNLPVIAYAVSQAIEPVPGFMTPTEAFAAIDAGARRLKLFPGSAFGSSYLSALRDVLPSDIGVWAVGGVDANNLAEWRAKGAAGFGIGSSLYRAGDDAETVGARARQLVASWQKY